LISTGHTALKTIDASCIGVPKSKTTTKTGTRAGGGIARANWSTGLQSAYVRRERPTAMPRAIPATAAIAKPVAMRPRLGRMLSTASAVRNACPTGPENHRS
jgi:hypothetical protein